MTKIRAVTADEMRRIDEMAIRKFGIPSLILMENAGRAVADRAAHWLKRSKKSKILILCGTGNNGGDGFVVARHLSIRGFRVRVLLLGRAVKLRGDAKVNYGIVKKMGIEIKELPLTLALSPSFAKASEGRRQGRGNTLKDTDAIVDAIFGTGLSRPIEGFTKEVINQVNQAGRPVISIDIPSGLNATTGEVMGCAVRAQETVTLAVLKTGFLKKKAKEYTGKITVADISIPRVLLHN